MREPDEPLAGRKPVSASTVMSLSKCQKKRKVDEENREFKAEWTEKYAFILPKSSTRPMCLICTETVALVKSANVKRHYDTKHAYFEAQFPQNSEVRTTKVNQLKSSYEGTHSLFRKTLTLQERVTEASFRVVWVLAKHKKPFSDAEIVKECINEVVEAMFEGNEKDKLSDMFDKIPLSDSTAVKRVEVLAHDIVQQLTEDLKNAQCISLAADESTDRTDKAQLCVFVRYLSSSKGVFCEDILGVAPLLGHTTGDDVSKAIMQMLNERGIDIKTVVSIATDGAPSMTGKTKGAVKRLKEHHPGMLAYHCIIHQSVLCASLGKEYADVMENVMKLVNYLRASSALQHRLLRTFLTEVRFSFEFLALFSV